MSALDLIRPNEWDSLKKDFYKDRTASQEFNDYASECTNKKTIETHPKEHIQYAASKAMASMTDNYLIYNEHKDLTDEEIEKLYSPGGRPSADSVDKPAHYNNGSIEAIEYIKQQTGEGFKDYLYGNAIKYMHRHRYKGKPVEDLRKAQWYITRMIQEECNVR